MTARPTETTVPECTCKAEIGPCPACAEGATKDEPYSNEAARLSVNPKNVPLHQQK